MFLEQTKLWSSCFLEDSKYSDENSDERNSNGENSNEEN